VPDSPSSPLRVAVVGGGVAGLAAAHRLRQLLPDAELQLFEAGPRLGGPLHTLHRGDLVMEQGADSFLAKDRAVVELCRELGLGDDLIPTNAAHRRALVVCRGRLEPVPDGFVLMEPRDPRGLWRSSVLGLAGKLRALAEPWIRAPRGVRSADYDESVTSFATRRLGREAFERLIEPLMAGIYVADAKELSLAATMPEFLKAEREHGSLAAARHLNKNLRLPPLGGEGGGGGMPLAPSQPNSAAAPRPNPPLQGEGTGGSTESGARYGSFLTFKSGMTRLSESLATQLSKGSVRLDSPVASLSKSEAKQWRVTSAANLTDDFDGVVLAIPARRAATLLEPSDKALAELLGQIRAASSVVVTLVYAAAQIARPLDAFGIVVPRIENRPIVAVSFPSVKFPGRGSAEFTPVRVFLGGVLRPRTIEHSDADLVAIAERELADLLGVRGAPREALVARWRESMPQYRVGHIRLVGAIDERVAAHRGLELAGASYRGVGIPQCIASGRAAAERLAAQLGAAS
jgi:oxygen-dependent protoporphyrinogen oxidase